MNRRSKIGILTAFTLLVLNGWLVGPLLAQQEVEVPIEGISSSDKLTHFCNGEELRKQMKFEEAIEEYRKVIAVGESCGKESEAHYNIGLCYTWLYDLEEARDTFNEVIQTYPDDGNATAFAEFGLAWVETQEGKYGDAIDRLQRKLAENTCPDMEHSAAMQFHIGRIYLVHLRNYEKAKETFQRVLQDYPNSKIANHPWLDELKGVD